MGQKTNPNIFRLGVNKTWKTEFFEKKKKATLGFQKLATEKRINCSRSELWKKKKNFAFQKLVAEHADQPRTN